MTMEERGMTARADLHKQFVERFHAGKRTRAATEEQIAAAESALGALWPESYRHFCLNWGAAYTPSILDLVVAKKSEFSDVQQFLKPQQTVTETRRWHLSPNGGCLAFAADSSGNWFIFHDLPASLSRPDDAAVWLFDLETGAPEMQANSFDEWIGRFLTL
jgi:hypothetical protein